MNDVRLLPSLLAWSAVPWTESETELKVLWAVSDADLAMFLVTELVGGGRSIAAWTYDAASILVDWGE